MGARNESIPCWQLSLRGQLLCWTAKIGELLLAFICLPGQFSDSSSAGEYLRYSLPVIRGLYEFARTLVFAGTITEIPNMCAFLFALCQIPIMYG